MEPSKNKPPWWQSLRSILLVAGLVVLYAFGTQVTRIDLAGPRKPSRQSQLLNILRRLARPDLLLYDTETVNLDVPILIPCQGSPPPAPDFGGGPSVQISTQCAEPGQEITVSGKGFPAGEALFLKFIPATEGSEIELKLIQDKVTAAPDGTFSVQATLRKDRLSDTPQLIRVTFTNLSGAPHASAALKSTWDKIIETVFLALMATTMGTALAIPVSFLAARNLMMAIRTSVPGLMASIIALPLGWYLGMKVVELAGGVVGNPAGSAALLGVGGLALASVATETVTTPASKAFVAFRRLALWFVATAVVAFVLSLIARGAIAIGTAASASMASFAFLPNFLTTLAQAVDIILPLAGGMIGAAVVSSFVSPPSEWLAGRIRPNLARLYTLALSALAGAALGGLVAALLVWLYQPQYPAATIAIPIAVGALSLLLVVFTMKPTAQIRSGAAVYYFVRTILNVLRAIEPLIMAIVFVVFVGIGPFAGVLALTLHTIAALGKLYSEQVENIAQGPIEAVTATGANRLQTIVYAVIPQIIPPYIAFTIYRWDINVRLSTIIGFAGGGGIGFLLQQNLNLLKYRQASVQMIAIAIVVASMDYLSARLREEII
jgi:phosphonate ABC transporter permease subunit PhnE